MKKKMFKAFLFCLNWKFNYQNDVKKTLPCKFLLNSVLKEDSLFDLICSFQNFHWWQTHRCQICRTPCSSTATNLMKKLILFLQFSGKSKFMFQQVPLCESANLLCFGLRIGAAWVFVCTTHLCLQHRDRHLGIMPVARCSASLNEF